MTIPRSLILSLCVLIILLWTSLVNEAITALPEKVGSSGQNHALIIGISNYDDLEKLASPAKDAKEIARILLEKYDFKKENVVLLTDDSEEKPTRDNILIYLDQYVNKLTEKENLLIFFSGHSAEDEKGETYWIPKNGKKGMKFTWLKHSDIIDEYLAADNFKVKNLCILTDSFFSKELLKPASIVLSPWDLRYREKIMEKAQSRSREVIAFGDKHWPSSKKTEGHGLFTYYLRKALLDNWLKVIDIENLLFEEDTIFQIRKIAGTRLLRGRFKRCSMEKGGQTVITRVISPPVVNIVDSFVSPKKGFVGDRFIIEAKTSSPAFEVYVEMGGRKYIMDGSGTDWRHSVKVASLGTTDYNVIAINADDIEGIPEKGEITTLPLVENLINVTQAQVSPKRGLGGEEFTFKAVTDVPAKGVTLYIMKKKYEMSGSDRTWSLTQRIEDAGTLDFELVAKNQEGLEGRSKGGILVIEPPKVNIVTVEATPGKGYVGDEFLITAKTDFNAISVSLEMDGVNYAMEGSGKTWTFKKNIPDIGDKRYTIKAKNVEGITGSSKSGVILIKEKPLGIPDVITVALSPTKIYAGENFIVKVETSENAKEVILEIEGKKHTMEGTGTDWSYLTRIAKVGTTGFKVLARNKAGEEGLSKEGEIITLKKAAAMVTVVKVEVSPGKGYAGERFTFKAKTDVPAKAVTVTIAGKAYKMTGSDTDWSLSNEVEYIGSIVYSMIAENEDGVEGSSKGGILVVKAPKANIVKLEAAPDKGFAGEEFQIFAHTDLPADSVSLEMDGVTYNMEGFGKKWLFKKRIPDVGKKEFTVIAKNVEGVEGGSKSGEILTMMAIPDVVSFALNPKKIFEGENFVIMAKTSATAEEVYIELEGKRYLMEGKNTEWKYQTKISKVGTSSFKIQANNKEGVQGREKEGEITTTERVVKAVDVVMTDVNPKMGDRGQPYTFKATTNADAQSVTVVIGEKRFKMAGSGTNWSLEKRIEELGTIDFYIVATNEKGLEGISKSGIIIIKDLLVNIVEVKAAPDKGFAGEEFQIFAHTDLPADSVSLEMDGVTYNMEGSGKKWLFKKRIQEVGKKEFTVIAKNVEGVEGGSKSGEILTTMEIPDVVSFALNPKEIFEGENFVIDVKTSAAAEQVFVEIGGERHVMTGAGTDWSYLTRIAKVGTTGFKVLARNKAGEEGLSKEGEIITLKKVAAMVNVAKVEVSPEKGYAGERFTFKAKTDVPAKAVTLTIAGKAYNMTGSDTDWSLSRKIEDIGSIAYSMIAINEAGVEGRSKVGVLLTEALLANVIGINVTSKKGYIGEEYLIAARTDNPASSVSLVLDDLTYKMEGSGKNWTLKKRISEAGKKTFTVIAKNIEGRDGKSKIGEIIARMAIPNVTNVAFKPEEIFAGDSFVIKVATSSPADKVVIELDGKEHIMEGTGTEWRYEIKMDTAGSRNYKVFAHNKEGKIGLTKEGKINALKKPLALITVAKIEVTPAKGYSGGKFTFKASTNVPALKVTFTMGGESIEMAGSGTEWSLSKVIKKTGEMVFSIAAFNEDNVEGVAKTASIEVHKLKYRYEYNNDGTITDKITGEIKERFKDNGNGTITDLATNLMWLQTPKTIAVSYEEAEEYCRELDSGGFSGWRLPTASEWNVLIDKSQKAPALPQGHPFKNIIVNIFFWSKTRHKSMSQRIYVADLYTGKIGAQSKNNQYIVWPVRYVETEERLAEAGK